MLMDLSPNEVKEVRRLRSSKAMKEQERNTPEHQSKLAEINARMAGHPIDTSDPGWFLKAYQALYHR